MISSSFIGNNPSLQIHSFSKDRGKGNKTCSPSISNFSTILASNIPILADSSHLPSDEAFRQRLSLPCNRLSTPCYEFKPNARHFFDKNFIKAWFFWEKMCLFCHMTSVGWLEIMIQHTPSIICNFHFPVDFRLDVLFPHIFWFLHQNWVVIDGFALTKLRHAGDEEKPISSCLDTRCPMIAPHILQQTSCHLLCRTYVRCRTCMTYDIVRATHDIVLYIVRAMLYVRTMSYVYIRHRAWHVRHRTVSFKHSVYSDNVVSPKWTYDIVCTWHTIS